MGACGIGREDKGLPIPRGAAPRPSPEIGPAFALFPPLMKMPSGPRPPAFRPLLSLALMPNAVPLGSPGWGPSGDMETRAERLPAGIAGGGATVAGAAESARRRISLS